MNFEILFMRKALKLENSNLIQNSELEIKS